MRERAHETYDECLQKAMSTLKVTRKSLYDSLRQQGIDESESQSLFDRFDKLSDRSIVMLLKQQSTQSESRKGGKQRYILRFFASSYIANIFSIGVSDWML